MTTETTLAIDAMRRDLERYRNSVDEAARERIKARMIDTVESMGHKVIRDDIVDTVIRMVKANKIIDEMIEAES